MDEKEELIQQLKTELEWVNYRMKMLDIIEGKLLRMRASAEKVKGNNLSEEEIEATNVEIHNLEEQVRALDGESRRIEDGKILE